MASMSCRRCRVCVTSVSGMATTSVYDEFSYCVASTRKCDEEWLAAATVRVDLPLSWAVVATRPAGSAGVGAVAEL